MLPFVERLERASAAHGPTCVGIDPHPGRLPDGVGLRDFCLGVVDAVATRVASIKPQVAFFERHGPPGVAVLEEVVDHARERGLLVVLDAKRGDIGSTAEAYAETVFERMGADCVTLSPYLGPESLGPFLRRCERGHGVFVLVRTSNPGAGAWQQDIAGRVADWIAEQPRELSIGAVVGATVQEDWRGRMPASWFLLPGFGAQGAGPEEVRVHLRPDGSGALVVSARRVLFPREGRDGGDWQAAVAARAEQFAADVRMINA